MHYQINVLSVLRHCMCTARCSDAPTLTRGPQDRQLLSNETLVLQCRVDAAPFPDVLWTQNGQPVNLTERVFLAQFSASLEFATLELNDSGTYRCRVENLNGSAASETAELNILGMYAYAHSSP